MKSRGHKLWLVDDGALRELSVELLHSRSGQVVVRGDFGARALVVTTIMPVAVNGMLVTPNLQGMPKQDDRVVTQ